METVTSCKPIKVWEKDGKEVQIYESTLSDGTKGESFGKETPEWPAQEALDITEGQYGKKIKLKSQGSGFGKKPQIQPSTMCLSYAKDLVVAGKLEFKDILPAAEKFLNWVKQMESK